MKCVVEKIKNLFWREKTDSLFFLRHISYNYSFLSKVILPPTVEERLRLTDGLVNQCFLPLDGFHLLGEGLLEGERGGWYLE